MDELLAHLEDLKVQFRDDAHLATMINNGWSIMDKYAASVEQLFFPQDLHFGVPDIIQKQIFIPPTQLPSRFIQT